MSEVDGFVCAGENEDEKLNEVMYEAWRFNRDCKLLRDGLQGLSWDGQYHFHLILTWQNSLRSILCLTDKNKTAFRKGAFGFWSDELTMNNITIKYLSLPLCLFSLISCSYNTAQLSIATNK